jgi:asparagine synthase (glutamine-hydrolysing)
MCGFVGVAGVNAGRLMDVLHGQCDTMMHRGPDDSGSWWAPDRSVGLAHRRLSILDLSSCGRQPMTDAAGDLQIVFNGEIYNHESLRQELVARGYTFRSATDTEVILAAYRAWGTDCLSRFTGMFAFALYDQRDRRIFLARDRAGEKPLFYSMRRDQLLFGSELKALMGDQLLPRVLDRHALEFYLAYGYVPGDQCILAGVSKLPAAHALLYDIDGGSGRIWRYWHVPPPDGNAAAPSDLVSELESLLEDSVRQQLVADVPVGILLSGGLDSSIVTALAARVSPDPVRTFTITFPGHNSYDEGPYARLVADHFGTVHTELAAEPASVALLPLLARQFDEPIADSSMIPTFLVAQLIRQHATVALGGDGGDELFGGYEPYSWMLRMERLRPYVPRPLRRAVGLSSQLLMPVGMRGRNYLIGASADFSESLAHSGLYFDARLRRQLLRGRSVTAPEAYKANLCAVGRTPLRQMTETDFLTYMVDDILVKVDRASMLASLEMRAPWLDHRVVEFAFRHTPDELKATANERKILPRLLAERLLPATLDLRRKQGFSIPFPSWFRGAWGEYCTDILREADRELFDIRVIEGLLQGQRRGLTNTHRIFALTMFELWRREYRVQTT